MRISHKEYVPSSILALPSIKPSGLEENSDIRKCGQWLDIQLVGILIKPKKCYPISNRAEITTYCSTSIAKRLVREIGILQFLHAFYAMAHLILLRHGVYIHGGFSTSQHFF